MKQKKNKLAMAILLLVGALFVFTACESYMDEELEIEDLNLPTSTHKY